MDFLSALQSMLSAGQAQGAPAAAGVPAVPIPKPKPEVPQVTDDGLIGGIRRMFDGDSPATTQAGSGFDWNNMLRDVGEGLANSHWSDNPFQSFGKGVSGAGRSADERNARERTNMLQDEDRTFRRERAKSSDARASRSDARADQAASRAARAAKFGEIKTSLDIMNMLDPKLDLQQRIAVEKAASDYAKSINPDGTMDPEQLRGQLEAFKNKLVGNPTAVPSAPPAAPPGVAVAPNRDTPAKPMDEASFQALPSGSWFINPADGRLLQKK